MSSRSVYSFIPPQEFPIACMYSQLIYGFCGLSFKYSSISAGLAYILLSISLILSYARFQNTPS